MARSVNDVVALLPRGPQLREPDKRKSYTITRCLPVEADGRIRYRIKSSDENFERVVFEDDISRQEQD